MRALVTALCCTLLSACTAAAGLRTDAAGQTIRKPDLYVYTATWCEPCRRLKADLDDDREFRASLLEKYCVRIYDYDRFRANADSAGVKALPAFFTRHGQFSGYEGKQDLADRLGLDWRPTTTRPSEPPATRSPENPAAPTRPATETIEIPPPPSTPRVDVPKALESAYERWGEHERTLDALRKRLERVEQTPIATPSAAAPAAPSLGTGDGAGLGSLVVWGLSQLGWTLGPIGGLAVGVGVPMAYRAIRRRLGRRLVQPPRDDPLPPDSDAPTVTTTTSVVVPPPTHTITSVVDPQHEAAFVWGCDQLIRRYPNSEATVSALKSYIDQYRASQGAARG